MHSHQDSSMTALEGAFSARIRGSSKWGESGGWKTFRFVLHMMVNTNDGGGRFAPIVIGSSVRCSFL